MAFDKTQTIDRFLDATASKQPAPGGGSVTALVGALSAAMGEMVLNYSAGKKELAKHEPELRAALSEFTRARSVLAELMLEDQAAFRRSYHFGIAPDVAGDDRRAAGHCLK